MVGKVVFSLGGRGGGVALTSYPLGFHHRSRSVSLYPFHKLDFSKAHSLTSISGCGILIHVLRLPKSPEIFKKQPPFTFFRCSPPSCLFTSDVFFCSDCLSSWVSDSSKQSDGCFFNFPFFPPPQKKKSTEK